MIGSFWQKRWPSRGCAGKPARSPAGTRFRQLLERPSPRAVHAPFRWRYFWRLHAALHALSVRVDFSPHRMQPLARLSCPLHAAPRVAFIPATCGPSCGLHPCCMRPPRATFAPATFGPSCGLHAALHPALQAALDSTAFARSATRSPCRRASMATRISSAVANRSSRDLAISFSSNGSC